MSDKKKSWPDDATRTPDASLTAGTETAGSTGEPRPPAGHDIPEAVPDLTTDPQTADPVAGAPVTAGPGEAVGESGEGPRPDTPPDLAGDAREADPLPPETAGEHLALEEPLTRAAEEEALPRAAPHPMPTTAMPPPRGSGFLPTLAGGVIAALLGGGVAWYLLSQQPAPPPSIDTSLNARVNEQAGAISELKAELARIAASPQSPAVPEEVTNQLAALRQGLEESRGQLGDLAGRLAALEARPAPESGAALPADLQEALRAQQARNEELATAFDQLRASTEERVGAATAQGTRAAQDALLARIAMAVTEGEGFAPLLDQAGTLGLAIPDTLRARAEGVPDEPALKAGFPEAARAALDASNLADARGGGFGERASAFLRNQLGVRSLAPREGTSPDAVLSRMQAAVEAGDFATALTESQALPAEGRAAMKGWLDGATARVGALKDIEGLQARLGE